MCKFLRGIFFCMDLDMIQSEKNSEMNACGHVVPNKIHTYAKFMLESFAEKVTLHIRDTVHVSRITVLRSKAAARPTSAHRFWFIHSGKQLEKKKQSNILPWQIRYHMLTFYMVRAVRRMHVASRTTTIFCTGPLFAYRQTIHNSLRVLYF